MYCLPAWLAGLSVGALDQLETLGVEAVPFAGRHRLQQGLFFLGAARRLQLVHGGEVEEDALVQVERGVLLHQALQLPQRLLQAAQVQQAHGRVVVGLWVHTPRGQELQKHASPKPIRSAKRSFIRYVIND